MRKTFFAAAIALIAFAGVAEAGGRNGNNGQGNNCQGNSCGSTVNNPSAMVNSITGNIDVTRTRSTTTTTVNKIDRANYAGVGTINNAEHNGVVEIRTNGGIVGSGSTNNLATSNATAREIAGSVGGNIGPIGGNLSGQISGHQATSNVVSGSTAALTSNGANGSGRVAAGGYAATSNFSGRQWGESVTNTHQIDVTNVNRVVGAGSLSTSR